MTKIAEEEAKALIASGTEKVDLAKKYLLSTICGEDYADFLTVTFLFIKIDALL